MTPAAPGAPLVIVCGLDHANLAEEQEVFAKAGVRFRAVAARTETEYLERCGEADGLLVQYGAITLFGLAGSGNTVGSNELSGPDPPPTTR